MDFPHYGDPLAEIGHIWGFWALSGESMGVNVATFTPILSPDNAQSIGNMPPPSPRHVQGGRRHISDALRRVLSSYFSKILPLTQLVLVISYFS